jgi:hypothetical protein
MFRRALAALLVAAGVGVAAEVGWLAGSARRPPAARAEAAPADPVWPVDHDPVLDRPVARLDLTEATVDDAVDAVRRAAGVNIVNLYGLARTPVAPARPVTLRLTDVTAATALRAILSQAGSSDPAIAARDGVIFVGRTDEPLVRVYDVRSLAGVGWVPSEWQTARTGYDLYPVFPAASPLSEAGRMIRSAVDPHSWQDGGGIGVLWEWNGVIVVAQTPDNHERIARFLRSLRRATDAAGPATRPRGTP